MTIPDLRFQSIWSRQRWQTPVISDRGRNLPPGSCGVEGLQRWDLNGHPELWGRGEGDGRRAYGFVYLLTKVRLPRVAVLVFRRSLPLRHRRTPIFSHSSASRRRFSSPSDAPRALPLKPFTMRLENVAASYSSDPRLAYYILYQELREMGRRRQVQCSEKFSLQPKFGPTSVDLLRGPSSPQL